MKIDRKKLAAGAAIALFITAVALLCVFAGGPILKFISEPGVVRTWASERGALAQLCFVGLMALQIVLAFIPGEPLEIAAGCAFGALNGTLLCLLGAAIGSLIVFLFVRHWGIRVVEVFFPREKIHALKWMKDEKKLSTLLVTLFLIPGTPKDIMTYAAGLTAIRLPKWMMIATFARVPSIVTSTVGGDALGLGQYGFAVAVFAATLIVAALGLMVYRRLCR